MQEIKFYQDSFLSYLESYTIERKPKRLYDPINYILNLGGKRLRPTLTLVACDIFGGDFENALDAALCVEVFHNFTLVHDDIMDAAPFRRGKETVHEKWNLNTGILSGDAMLIMAYRLLESYKPAVFKALIELFSKTAIEVCEGQQYDIDFETRNDVAVTEYLKMIEYKTAVLVGAAMKMGAIVAGATPQDQDAIYDFGRYLGIAFQLQDDYLDAFGNPETFGKQIGGDIIENKKTYLYLKALEFSSSEKQSELLQWYNSQTVNPEQKIEAVKQIFTASNAEKATKKIVEDYTKKAFDILERIPIAEEKKTILRTFGTALMTRNI